MRVVNCSRMGKKRGKRKWSCQGGGLAIDPIGCIAPLCEEKMMVCQRAIDHGKKESMREESCAQWSHHHTMDLIVYKWNGKRRGEITPERGRRIENRALNRLIQNRL